MQLQGCQKTLHTTKFGVFAGSGDPLGEGPCPLVEGFAQRKLSTKATRWSPTGEAGFAESFPRSSRRTCAERASLALAEGPLTVTACPGVRCGGHSFAESQIFGSRWRRALRREPDIWLSLKKGFSTRAVSSALSEELYPARAGR
jgi:hypothetical protein